MSETTDPTAGERADHPGTDPGNGKTQCGTCGKWVWLVTHSCKGVRVYPGVADDPRGPNFTGGPPMHTGKTPAEPDAGDVGLIAGVRNAHTLGPSTYTADGWHAAVGRLLDSLDAVRRKAGDEAVRKLVDELRELADDLTDNVDWSPGRPNYSDNEAWETAGKRLRAVLAMVSR